jgi:hypothetical protein
MSYRELQERGRIEVERSKDQRSRSIFDNVESFIQSRREFDDLPAGDPHLRNAVLHCRSKGMPVGSILTVRKQMVARWI